MELNEIKSEVLGALKAHTDELSAAIAKSDDELKEFGKVSESVKNEIAALSEKGKDIEARLDLVEQKAARHNDGTTKIKSLGQMFVESQAAQDYAAKNYHKGQSGRFELKDITSSAASVPVWP